MIKTQENGKKPHFGSDLGLLDTISCPNSSSVTRYLGQLSSLTISEKTNDLIMRKINDGRTDGQTDKRTEVIS